MGVDDVHRLGPHDLAHAAPVAERAERIAPCFQREAAERLEAGLARLLLEAVARDETQQDAVPARPQPDGEPDDRLGAAGPPAIGHQMQDRERP